MENVTTAGRAAPLNTPQSAADNWLEPVPAEETAQTKAPRKKSRGRTAAKVVLGIVAAVAVAAAVAAGAYTGLCAYVANSDVIWPGITVLGQDLGGMTVQDAAARLNSVIPDIAVDLYLYNAPDGPGAHTRVPDYTIPLVNLGAELDGLTIAQAASDVNLKDPPFFSLGKQYLTGEGVSEYRQTIQLNSAKETEQAQKAAEALCIAVTPSSYTYKDQVVSVTTSIDGRTVKAEDIVAKLDTIRDDTSALVFDIPYTIDTVESVKAADIREVVYKETKNAYFNRETWSVAAGQHGVDFDAEAFQAKIDAAGQGETVTTSVTVTEPQVSSTQLKAVLFRDKLSETRTPLTGGSARITNVRLASNAINNTVVNAGETMSYNATTGQRTKAKGYQEAPAYVNGLTVNEVGGGVCQPSSTLYYACLKANLQITERYAHRYIPSYITPGMDATVSWGGPDYKWTNNTLYPIKVVSFISDGYIYVQLFGTNVTGYHAEMTNELISTTDFTTVYAKDPSLPSGTISVTPYTGYKYRTYRKVYDANGKLISSNYEATSDYKKRDRVIIQN